MELLEITGTTYTQIQVINISYAVLRRYFKFNIAIREWNRMPQASKTWIYFKSFFRAAHREIQAVADITTEESGIFHYNMVHYVLSGLMGVLLQEPPPTEIPAKNPFHKQPVEIEMINQVVNAVTETTTTQKQLGDQLQHMWWRTLPRIWSRWNWWMWWWVIGPRLLLMDPWVVQPHCKSV